MQNRYSLTLCASLAVLLSTGAARAQVAAAPGGSQSTASGAIGELVVIAQRRAESVQDVPISTTAFDRVQLEKSVIQSLPEIARITPGLQFQAVGSNSVPFLRGIGAATTTAGAESAVALVVDGVYLAAQPASLMSMSNTESIEVDRGPQGTLFGRNATGGVIQITTRRPGQTPRLDASIGYSNYGTWDGSFYGSSPLTSNLAADISVSAHNQTDGYGKNLFNGSDVYKGYDYSVRSKWFLQAGDKTEVTVIGNYEKLRSQDGFATRLPAAGELGLNERGRGGFQYSGGFYDVNLNYPSFNETETEGGSLDIVHDFDFAKLRSITAIQNLEWIGQVDFDLGPNDGSHQRFQPREQTQSEELQLLSPDDNKKFNWVLGTFLYKNLASYDPVHIQYPASGPLTETFVHSKQKTKSWSVFAQGTYEVLPGTRVTAGVRYTEDTRKFYAVQTSAGPLPGPLSQTGNKTFPKLTFHGGLDHRFDDNLLAFAQFTRGYKSGFFNTLSLQPSNSTTPTVIQPETLDAVEVGEKSDWLDRHLRVNVSAFYYDYQNQQVNAFIGTTRILLNAANSHVKGLDVEVVTVPVENLTVSVIGEYLDAKYQDFPGAPLFTPVPAPGIGNAATPFNAAGKRDVNAPKFTTTLSVDYRIPTDFGRVILNGDLYHNSGYYFDFANTRHQGAYNYLGASAKFEFGDGRWDMTLWGKNLVNEKVYGSVNQVAAGPGGLFGGDSMTPRAPRTFGVKFGAHL